MAVPGKACPSADRLDIVWTDRSVRLVSPLVRHVFSERAGPRDAIQWLPAEIVDHCVGAALAEAAATGYTSDPARMT